MAYQPIGSYGVIGDLHSVALVGLDGSIDWCCLPHFDSPSVFGALLDDKIGGKFQIGPAVESTCRQMYLPDTNVLLTRYLNGDGVGEVLDFMPVSKQSGGLTESNTQQIVRIVRAVRGTVRLQLLCRPAFDYARSKHTIEKIDDGVVFRSGLGSIGLRTTLDLQLHEVDVRAEWTLRAGETTAFALRYSSGDVSSMLREPLAEDELLKDTVRYWRNWMSHSRYRGRWRETVNRSALALKLLTFQPTGAIVAAATTSLPEEIGGVRNWDYRFTWVRDAAFSVYALMRLGYTDEAAAFTNFIQARALEAEPTDGPLNVMYGIDGRHNLEEIELSHLDGYRGSKPVRAGNGAVDHLQLDIYGELMDSVYLYDKYGEPMSYDMWRQIERMLDWVAGNWKQPDQGIWEVRGGRQHFTYSKLQCWVALDRGLRLSTKRSLPINGNHWREQRDEIYRAIMREGWDPEMKSFVQYFGSKAVDASALMMPLMLFLSPTDPRMISTVERIRQELMSDSLVYRYRIGTAAEDGLPGGEGTFSICTFWMVEAMTRCGRLEEAQFLFEKMLTYANHLGLFAEQIGPTGEALGNFPQAFTHLGLISAAFNLDRMLDGKR